MAAIEVCDSGGVRWVTFSRPDKPNAPTVDELLEATRSLGTGSPSAVFGR